MIVARFVKMKVRKSKTQLLWRATTKPVRIYRQKNSLSSNHSAGVDCF